MESTKRYEEYPVWIVILTNLVSLSIYALGFFILLKAGFLFAFLFLLYILILEYRLLKKHCTNCCYWGRRCAFGKGRISSMFFRQGDVSNFCTREMTWKDMIPDILVSVIPVCIGFILLILKFDIILLSSLLLLLLLSSVVTGFIRGRLTCRYCRQRDLGCPADLLFNKER